MNTVVLKQNVQIKFKNILVEKWMYSRGQKKRDTRCYSDTYHRREMKLVPFFIEKCPL